MRISVPCSRRVRWTMTRLRAGRSGGRRSSLRRGAFRGRREGAPTTPRRSCGSEASPGLQASSAEVSRRRAVRGRHGPPRTRRGARDAASGSRPGDRWRCLGSRPGAADGGRRGHAAGARAARCARPSSPKRGSDHAPPTHSTRCVLASLEIGDERTTPADSGEVCAVIPGRFGMPVTIAAIRPDPLVCYRESPRGDSRLGASGDYLAGSPQGRFSVGGER